LFEDKDVLLKKYQEERSVLVGEKKRMNVDSFVEIEKREKEINHKIISEKMTPQQEKAISAQLVELRKKRNDFGSLKEREERVNEMENTLKRLNGELKNINEVIKEKRDEIMSIKSQIEKINEKSKVKSDVVQGYENKIEELKKRKEELISKKKKE
jgi:uncharacterized coiled-coil DUF342 family protein